MLNNECDVEKAKKLANFLKLLAKKITENPNILADLDFELEDIPTIRQKKKKEESASADLNIYQMFSNSGEFGLREELNSLDVEILRQIISCNSLDSSKLSRKWRKKDRLINLIVEKVAIRNEKGKSFKSVK
jgi:hypothetical protein